MLNIRANLRPDPLMLFTAGLSLGSIAVLVLAVVTGGHPGNVWIIGTLAVVAAVAERGTVKLGRDLEQSISLVPTLFAAVLFGPLAAILVSLASMAGEFTRPQAWKFDRPSMRLSIYTSSRILSGAAAGWVAMAVQGGDAGAVSKVALATVVAAVAAEGLDVVIAAATLHLRKRQSVAAVLRTFGPILALSVALYTPVVAFLAYAYRDISPWTLPLFLVPTLAAQRMFGLYQEQRELAEDLVRVNRRLERANVSFSTALVATLDARDEYTAGHSMAVAIYSRDICERLGLSPDDQQRAYLCGLVHDIGKVGLPSGLLEKPGPLSLEERRLMQEHAVIGERILANVEDYAEIANIVRHHHERVDGNGYPDGICGKDIPLVSRIIAVADAYNAMTSDRPYRDAMPSRVARMRMAQAVESQFDTTIVAAFEAILAAAPEEYRVARSEQFLLTRGSAAASSMLPLTLDRAV